MSFSHAFDLNATPEMRSLLTFITARFQQDPTQAAHAQPEFERGLREHMLAVERRIHSADFERLDVDAQGIVVDGERYQRREGKTPGEYMTLAGKIQVIRTTYRQRGGHGGRTIAPLELRLGLVGHWSQAAAQAASAFMAAVPSAEAAELLAAAGTMTPSSSHLDRLPKLVSEVWEAHRIQLDADVREAGRLDLPPPEKVAFVVMSLDGIMVPMKDAPRSGKSGRRAQGPQGHQEVGCATLSLYDDQGERLHTLRFGRMPESRKVSLHEQMAAEAMELRTCYPNAQWHAVADGARDNWRILDDIIQRLGCKCTKLLDFYHAVEHLDDGLKASGSTDEEVSRFRRLLRDDPDGGELIIEELAYRTTESGKRNTEKALNYFLGQAERLDYAEHAAAHRPIGSGVQEAACKTLVAERMKRSGMSWRPDGGQAILTLRGLVQSGRLSHAWQCLRPSFNRPFKVDPSSCRKSPQRSAA